MWPEVQFVDTAELLFNLLIEAALLRADRR